MTNNNSFVFYEDFGKILDRVYKTNPAMAGRFAKAIVDYGLYQIKPNEEDDVWLYGLEMIFGAIDRAKERYQNRVGVGKTGGRPKEHSDEEIKQLKEQGLSQKAIAERLNCSTSTVKRALAQSEFKF